MLHMEAGLGAQQEITAMTLLEQRFGLLLEATPDAMICPAGKGSTGVNRMMPLRMVKSFSRSLKPNGTEPKSAQCFFAASMYSIA